MQEQEQSWSVGTSRDNIHGIKVGACNAVTAVNTNVDLPASLPNHATILRRSSCDLLVVSEHCPDVGYARITSRKRPRMVSQAFA